MKNIIQLNSTLSKILFLQGDMNRQNLIILMQFRKLCLKHLVCKHL